jgi:hypothetical protein
MSKHSAGPWVIQDNAAHGVHIYSAGGCFGGGFHLARLSRPGVLVAAAPGESERQLRANAHLMSAAPELLAALKRWEHYGCPDCGGDCSSANPPVACCIMQETRAAIAMVEGGA